MRRSVWPSCKHQSKQLKLEGACEVRSRLSRQSRAFIMQRALPESTRCSVVQPHLSTVIKCWHQSGHDDDPESRHEEPSGRRAVGLHSPTLAWMRTSAPLGGLTSGRSLPRPEESLALRCGREAPPSPNSTPSSNCQYATRSLCHGQIEKSSMFTTSNLTESRASPKRRSVWHTHTTRTERDVWG